MKADPLKKLMSKSVKSDSRISKIKEAHKKHASETKLEKPKDLRKDTMLHKKAKEEHARKARRSDRYVKEKH